MGCVQVLCGRPRWFRVYFGHLNLYRLLVYGSRLHLLGLAVASMILTLIFVRHVGHDSLILRLYLQKATTILAMSICDSPVSGVHSTTSRTSGKCPAWRIGSQHCLPHFTHHERLFMREEQATRQTIPFETVKLQQLLHYLFSQLIDPAKSPILINC